MGSLVPSSSAQVDRDGWGQDPGAVENKSLGFEPSPSQSYNASDFGSGSQMDKMDKRGFSLATPHDAEAATLRESLQ